LEGFTLKSEDVIEILKQLKRITEDKKKIEKAIRQYVR